jgi:hypothetical protein
MLKLVQDGSDSNADGIAALGALLLDQIVRDGARQMPLVRAGAEFKDGKLVERPDESGGENQAA